MRGAGRRQPLSEPIPIVDQLDAFALDRDDGRAKPTRRIGGANQDLVGIERAGTVIFSAIQEVVVAVGRKGRVRDDVADLRAVQLGRGKPYDGAIPDRLLPLPALLVPGTTHQPFDHAEMVAQDVRDVGVRFTEANDDLEQFADGAAGAAGGSRQAQRAQLGAPDEINRLKRQDTFPLAFAFALSDLGEQVFQLGGAEIDPARRGEACGG
jgi:hypothetical protein